MDSSAVENKTVEATKVKAVSQLESEYFYPASSGYQSITIRAATITDANAIYAERRRPVQEEKVDVSKETNNE